MIKGTNLATTPGHSVGRVVLAVQGGNQFIQLPQNIQGGTINWKSLQGLKMIPIQTQQNTNQNSSNLSMSAYLVFNTICPYFGCFFLLIFVVFLDSQISSTSQTIKPPNAASGDS